MQIKMISNWEEELAISKTATECAILSAQLLDYIITDEETFKIRLIDDSLFNLAKKIRMKTESLID